MSHDDDCRRFVLVKCHRGDEARGLRDLIQIGRGKTFEVESACFGTWPRSYVLWRAIDTPALYMVRGHGKRLRVLQLHEVERMFWPDGAQIDARPRRERMTARRPTDASRLNGAFR